MACALQMEEAQQACLTSESRIIGTVVCTRNTRLTQTKIVLEWAYARHANNGRCRLAAQLHKRS